MSGEIIEVTEYQHVVESPRERLRRLTSNPEFIDTVCENVAEGARLVELAQMLEVPFGAFSMWVKNNPTNREKFEHAIQVRGEWGQDVILSELRRIASTDIRHFFDKNGILKEPHDWPLDLARAVSSIKVRELFDNQGNKVGEQKEIKLWDKVKGLELLGNNLKMFTEKHEHSVAKTLEQLVSESINQTAGE